MALKVSVVVPTYRPGTGLERVVSSIERQTLSADEFELILVDDGSPDDTFTRLQQIRDTHSNVRIERIENSGWPSRPRNVGIDMARGEYILFMDHDDYLYPDALRASYEYAKANKADVLSPKESKTTDVGWGITNYTANMPNARESRGIASLLPMMPHKFYRREFLNEHQIRFPEGKRMLWEDVYFNVEAYRYARVISILSDTPVYRWVHTGTNNSASYGPESAEFWSRLTELFRFIVTTLPGAEFADAREAMLVHQYRTRVLGRFDGQLATNDQAGLPEAQASIQHIIDEFVPDTIDAKLTKLVQARSHLMRKQQVDLMRTLRTVDSGIAGISRANAVEWRDGRLHLTVTTSWTNPKTGEQLQLREHDGRILRQLPPELEAALPEHLLDVTDAVSAAATQLTIRSRDQHVTWSIPTESEVRIERGADSTVTVTVHATATVNLDTAAFGRPLEGTVWDFHARNTFMGMANHRALRMATTGRAALMGGRAGIAYRTNGGMLALNLAQKVHPVVAIVDFVTGQATSAPAGRGIHNFAIPLNGVEVTGETRLPGAVGLQPFGAAAVKLLTAHTTGRILRVLSRKMRPVGTLATRVARRLERTQAHHAAVLVGDDSGARLEGSFRTFPGSYTLVCRFNQASVVTSVQITVSLRGKVTFQHR